MKQVEKPLTPEQMSYQLSFVPEYPPSPGLEALYDVLHYRDNEFPFSPDGAVELYEYQEFTFWRWSNPHCKEPTDPLQTRCPRCLSTKIYTTENWIQCKFCNYNEPLLDFTISH